MCFAYQIFHRLGIRSLYNALHCCPSVGKPGTCRHTWARLRYSSPISGLLCLPHSESREPIQGKLVRNEKRLASLASVYKLDGLKFLRQTVADGGSYLLVLSEGSGCGLLCSWQTSPLCFSRETDAGKAPVQFVFVILSFKLLWGSRSSFFVPLFLGEQVPLDPVDLCGYLRGHIRPLSQG